MLNPVYWCPAVLICTPASLTVFSAFVCTPASLFARSRREKRPTTVLTTSCSFSTAMVSRFKDEQKLDKPDTALLLTYPLISPLALITRFIQFTVQLFKLLLMDPCIGKWGARCLPIPTPPQLLDSSFHFPHGASTADQGGYTEIWFPWATAAPSLSQWHPWERR